ncbi:MAG: hypothetical protein P1V51_00365 [Deltaproteobacteria bacterium]|nr:hypothetical protein [Deltaproteobacteria bacterium]
MRQTVDAIQVVERIWREHRTALLARSSTALAEVARSLDGPRADPEQALQAIERGMALPERNLEAALQEGFEVLAPRAGMDARRLGMALLKASPEMARWYAAALAESVGDGLVSAWRLFDHPSPIRWIWLRDLSGPALFHIRDGEVERYSPSELIEPLVARYGKVPRAVLNRLDQGPATPTEIESLVGTTGRHVLDALHRFLVVRRVAGHYRSRGTAVHFLRDAV